MVKMRKKGMFFTLGLSIIALVVLVLSIVIFNNFQTSEERFSNFIVFGRIYDLDISIQEGIKKIFDKTSGISLSTSSNTVIISENLPNSNNVGFSDEISNFKNFIESNFDNINLSVEDLNTNLTLIIDPVDVSYSHEDFGDRKIVLDYNENVSSVELYFWSNSSNGTVSFTSISSGSLDVNVVVEAPGGWHDEESASINPAQLSSAQISDLTGGNIEINFDQNRIDLESFTNDTVLSRTTLGLVTEYVNVNLPNVISIVFQDFGISKFGGVRIL